MSTSIRRTWIFAALLATVAVAFSVAFGASAPSAYAVTGQAGDSLAVAQIAQGDQAATVEAQAATKSVKKCKFTTTTKTIKKKALKVKKGTTKIKLKGESGYLRFTAPKTKKYSFKFSNMKNSKVGYDFSAFVEFLTPDADYPKYSFLMNDKVSTKGGKTNTLWLKTKGLKTSTKKVVDRPLNTRTGKVKLKKGQSVYLYFYNGYKGTTATLKIA